MLVELDQHPASESSVAPGIPMERLKLRRPDQRQVTFRAIEVEQLVGADHPVWAIGELSGQLDLSRFAAALPPLCAPNASRVDAPPGTRVCSSRSGSARTRKASVRRARSNAKWTSVPSGSGCAGRRRREQQTAASGAAAGVEARGSATIVSSKKPHTPHRANERRHTVFSQLLSKWSDPPAKSEPKVSRSE